MSNTTTTAFAPRKQGAPVLRTLSILLYGVPKTGKTTEAAKFPGAVLLNCEPSGTDLLKGNHDIFDIASLDHLERTAPAICASAYQTIVLDGFTWLINQAARDLVAAKGKNYRLPAYGEITDQAQRVLGIMLRAGKTVIATGHSRMIDCEGETEGKVEIRPDINPRLSDGVFGLFSIIAYCYPTAAGSQILTKPEDNNKRRILAGDRSGILPKIMDLSAEKLLAHLQQTQPATEGKKPAQAQTPAATPASAPNGKPLATEAQIAAIEQAGEQVYGVEWETSKRAGSCEWISTGGTNAPAGLTASEAERLLAALEKKNAEQKKAQTEQPATVAE